MNLSRPIVLVPCDVKQVGIHPFHAVGEKYINAVAHGAGCMPLLLPATGDGLDLDSLSEHVENDQLLLSIDGIFLPGSVSNVAPHQYGEELGFPDEFIDSQRDELTLTLLRRAVELGVPLFAVCRGFQEMNVAFGGKLHQQVHEQPGLMDHRADASQSREEQYALAHRVAVTQGGLLSSLLRRDEFQVNSIHEQGVAVPGDGLQVEATANDGLIEAFTVVDAAAFALGVQWHPEWRYWEDEVSRTLFEAFGQAARKHLELRLSKAA